MSAFRSDFEGGQSYAYINLLAMLSSSHLTFHPVRTSVQRVEDLCAVGRMQTGNSGVPASWCQKLSHAVRVAFSDMSAHDRRAPPRHYSLSTGRHVRQPWCRTRLRVKQLTTTAQINLQILGSAGGALEVGAMHLSLDGGENGNATPMSPYTYLPGSRSRKPLAPV